MSKKRFQFQTLFIFSFIALFLAALLLPSSAGAQDLSNQLAEINRQRIELKRNVRVFAQFREIALGNGRIDAQVTSAKDLTKDQEERISKALAKRFKSDVRLECKVDESLLGGVVIRAGDQVIDGSLRGRLRRLGSQLGRKA